MTTARARFTLALAWAALLVSLTVPALAQPAKPAPQKPPSPAAEEPRDPLGRHTPRGTITGFNEAAHRKDFVGAGQYLQATATQRRNAEELVGDLMELLDRYYIESITAISDTPDGTTTDGLPLDRERIVLRINDQPVDVELVRVKDPQAGLIWLISSRTLAQVPALFLNADETWLERLMPQRLIDRTMFGIPTARWMALAATFVIPFGTLWILSGLGMALVRLTVSNPRRKILDLLYGRLRWPVLTTLGLSVHIASMRFLGFSLGFREIYSRVLLDLLVVAFAFVV